MVNEQGRPFSEMHERITLYAVQAPFPLASEQSFSLETADQDALTTSWAHVHEQLRQRIGMVLYREYSEQYGSVSLFGGHVSV